ncbi:unnamed protein product [Hermetia illucens]|uniref:Sodium channel protein Nach n=1 Tax=Hermetia illucens TaxID=343691 RepID=A0A7R8YZ33_HERIL|nr:sodium channel protein Nach [Hermetia illucens]CAD7091134.1 unnamed protein product [Hermetia illucens]
MNNRVKGVIETLVLFRRSLIYQTKEFFNNSTLHGVRYIADGSRPFGEKFMWFSFTSIGAVAALVIIMSLWEKFQTNPTITGLDTDFHNQQIIFPTVVVCPTNPYNDKKVEEIAYKELAQYEESEAPSYQPFLRMLTKLSYQNIGTAFELSLNFTPAAVGQTSLRRLAFQVKMDCDDLLTFCRYRDEEVKCCPHFDEIYTERGFCFAFNTKFKSFETKDEQSVEFHDLFETDKKWALQFIPSSAVNVYIHSNREYFGWDFSPQLSWEPNQVSEILISMKETYTTEDAKQLSIGQRKCVFSDEIKLDFFPNEYTFSGCMKECRIKKCIKMCRCIPPFYKPLPNVPYCKVEQLECLAKYKDNITNIRDCQKCELSCSKTVYDVEKLNKDFSQSDEHSISIEYLTWPIIRYKREVLFGWVDLLVSFGGIAGLFLGFSLLSGVEILYYFTMRACCMVYKNREELYAIEEEIQRKPPPRFDMSLRIPMTKSNTENLRRQSLPAMSTASKTPHDKTLLNLTKRGKLLGPTPISHVSRKTLAAERIKKAQQKGTFKPIVKQVKPVAATDQPYWNNLRRKSLEPPRFEFLP